MKEPLQFNLKKIRFTDNINRHDYPERDIKILLAKVDTSDTPCMVQFPGGPQEGRMIEGRTIRGDRQLFMYTVPRSEWSDTMRGLDLLIAGFSSQYGIFFKGHLVNSSLISRSDARSMGWEVYPIWPENTAPEVAFLMSTKATKSPFQIATFIVP